MRYLQNSQSGSNVFARDVIRSAFGYQITDRTGLRTVRPGAIKQPEQSSQPPSSDPNRDKKRRSPSGRKPGGQPGRTGTTRKPIPDPDKIVTLKVSAKDLPQPRSGYREVEPVTRHVVDIIMSLGSQNIVCPSAGGCAGQTFYGVVSSRYHPSNPVWPEAEGVCGLSEPVSTAVGHGERSDGRFPSLIWRHGRR